MKKLIVVLICALGTQSLLAQEKKYSSRVGLSIPVMMNRSEGMHYLLGNRITSEGTAFSPGLNLNYSRDIFKNIYLTAGIGYFRQSFSLERYTIFSLGPVGRLPFYTKSYHYSNIQLTAGAGYRKKLSRHYAIDARISYNYLYSYHQKYTGKRGYKNYKTQSNHIPVGEMANLSLGLERAIGDFSLGLSILFPVSVNWNDDAAFFKYVYADDTQKIAINKFTIGSAVSINYYF